MIIALHIIPQSISNKASSIGNHLCNRTKGLLVMIPINVIYWMILLVLFLIHILSLIPS